MRFVLALMSFMFLFITPVCAEEVEDKNQELEQEQELDQENVFEEVVVTGNRSKTDYFKSNRSVSIVDEEKLQNEVPRTIPQALLDTAGVYVQETNYGGGSPIIRGLVGPQLLILVDGVRFNNSVYRTGPLQYLNMIDDLSIKRIEVLRGAGSTMYGSDAMGGVIQLFPSTPRDFRKTEGVGFGGKAIARFSSADSGQAYHLEAEAGKGGFGFLGGVTLKFLGDPIGGGDVGVQPYVGYNQVSASAQTIYHFSDGFFDGWYLKLSYLFTSIENAGRTDKLYDKKQVQFYDNQNHLLFGRLHMAFKPINTTAKLTLSYQNFYEQKDLNQLDDSLSHKLNITRDKTYVNTIGVDLQLITSLLSDRLNLNYGGSYYRDFIDADRYKKEIYSNPWTKSDLQYYPDGSSYDNFGAFALISGTPLKTDSGHDILLSGGYRLHGFAAYSPAQFGLTESDFSKIGHVFLASVQYIYKNNFNLAFTFSEGFRAPNLQEAALLGDTGDYFKVPNDGLKAEKSENFELLAKVNIWRIKFSLAGYVSLIKDLLKRVETKYEGQTEIGGLLVVHHQNAQKGILYGTEATLDFDIAYGLSLSGNISYTWGEEIIDDADNMPLSKIPPLFGQAKFRYDSKKMNNIKVFVETYLRAATKQSRLSDRDISDNRIPDGGTPGWWTLNLRAGLLGWDWVRTSISFENILDKKYKYHASGIYAPGRNVVFSLAISH